MVSMVLILMVLVTASGGCDYGWTVAEGKEMEMKKEEEMKK